MNISIITASYNYENFIKETIESVLAQTYSLWEMIIVDDGSKDNSIEVIKSYCEKDSRIKLYTHENNINKGLKDTLLLGLEKANNEWVVFLESDDTITPDYLEKKIQVIKNNPDANFIINDVNMFGDEKEKQKFKKRHFKVINKLLKSSVQPVDLSKAEIKLNYIVSFSVVMIKKGLLEKVDFNSPIKPFLDYYLWSQILRDNKVYYINEKLTNWRMHKDSYIADAASKYNIYKDAEFNIKKRKFLYKGDTRLQYFTHIFKLFRDKLKFTRKKYIRLHFIDRKLYLFGKWYNF